MKLSTKLLIGLLLFLVGCLFASNIILKGEYDKMDKKDPYRNYKTVLDKPFKHIVVLNSIKVGNVGFESGNAFSVKIDRYVEPTPNFETDYKIQNDTLFVEFKIKEQGYIRPYFNEKMLLITAPQSVTFEINHSNFEIGNYKLKDLEINLYNNAVVQFSPDTLNTKLNTLKINNTGSEFSVDSWTEFDTLEANLQDDAVLDLKKSISKTLKINGSDATSVNLSYKQLQTLMKK